jgi:P27 family predicted phage terminase small subunit
MPRKPLEHHLLQNTKPEYVTPDNPTPPGRPSFPKGISRDARKVFKRLCAMLEKRRALTEGDGEMLALYVDLFDRRERCLVKLRAEGEVVGYHRLNNRGEDVVTEKPNLHLKIVETCESKMISILDRLGLTPLNRSKVVPTEIPQEKQPMDELEALLERGKQTNAPAVESDPLEGLDDLPLQ